MQQLTTDLRVNINNNVDIHEVEWFPTTLNSSFVFTNTYEYMTELAVCSVRKMTQVHSLPSRKIRFSYKLGIVLAGKFPSSDMTTIKPDLARFYEWFTTTTEKRS